MVEIGELETGEATKRVWDRVALVGRERGDLLGMIKKAFNELALGCEMTEEVM